MGESPTLVELDGRRRLALGKLGKPEHRFYIAEELPDGTIRLTPAVVVPAAAWDLAQTGEDHG